MKTNKMFFVISILLMVAFAFANTAPSHSVTDGYYVTVRDTTIRSTAAWDTLGATDSLTVLTDYNPDIGWEYILALSPLTGTGADSLVAYIRVDANDENGNVTQYYSCPDSVLINTGTNTRLPFGSAVFGMKYDVKLLTTTGSGTQVIVNRAHLWKRRANITARQKDFKQ